MPIRPENKSRYPDNWAEISKHIRFARAGNRCECRGECGTHYPPHRCKARNGRPHPRTGSSVVLTVAHLDHTPENSDPENLVAMCQACHLAYDAEHHAETRRRDRERQWAERGQQQIPGVDDQLAVLGLGAAEVET